MILYTKTEYRFFLILILFFVENHFNDQMIFKFALKKKLHRKKALYE